jgi:hypothetical protein
LNISKFIFLALIGESLWETSKLIWQHGKLNVDRIGAIAVGMLLAFGTGIDLFEALEVPISIPFLGKLLTGLLLSRGANFMHDILGSVSTVYTNGKSRTN